MSREEIKKNQIFLENQITEEKINEEKNGEKLNEELKTLEEEIKKLNSEFMQEMKIHIMILEKFFIHLFLITMDYKITLHINQIWIINKLLYITIFYFLILKYLIRC